MTISGIWTVQENILLFNVQKLKAVCLALKSFQTENSKRKNSDSIRQRHYIQLSEQTGGHVRPSLPHLGLLQSLKYTHRRPTYSWLLKCHSQQPLQKGQCNSYRMIFTPLKVQDNLQVWHKSMKGFICRLAASWPTAILEIFSYEADIYSFA